MSEVIEHVEQPIDYLKKITEVTHNNSYIYVTTCMNSPAIDHISLFETVGQIESLVLEANLKIIDKSVNSL